MNCFICNRSDTLPGFTSVQLERGGMTLTVTNVPARICPNCHEAYTDLLVADNLLHQAENIFRDGLKLESVDYGLD